MQAQTQGNLIILTGPSQAGKTTLIGQLVEALRQHDVKLTGLTSPAVFADGQKTGISAVDLTSGETRLLAVYAPQAEDPSAEHRPLQWRFDVDVIRWGNQVFTAAIPTEVLIVDEIGPLELQRGQGWSAALSALDSRQYDLAILVMRPALLAQSQQRWAWGEVMEVAHLGQVGACQQAILEKIWPS